jgi:hypothetical protein
MRTLAIIGTAGRKEDKTRLTLDHYERMVPGILLLINHLKLDHKDLHLVSGGAAWADHVAVTFKILMGIPSEQLTLYLPATLGKDGYYGSTERAQKTADTANYYHREFSRVIQRDTLGELLAERSRGCNLIDGNGSFHARNADVAKSTGTDGLLVAFTFGDDLSDQRPWTGLEFPADTTAEQAGLKDGGTAHTFNLAKCSKWHFRLGDF